MPTLPEADLAAAVRAGTDALEAGDLDGALTHFRRVIDAHPERPEGHNNLGALYVGLQNYAAAETCFDRVLELLPDSANVMFNRGIARMQLEKFDEAYEDFRQASAALPEDPEVHNNLGVATYMRGSLDEAREHLHRALELRADYATALVNLCDVEVTDGASAKAVELCTEYLRSHPDDLEIHRHHFRLLTSDCEVALAAAGRAAEKILAVDESDSGTRRSWGRILEAREALAEAAEA